MINLINLNTRSQNYFVDEVYAHSFMAKHDLLDLYKSGIVVLRDVRQEEILNEIFDFVFFIISKTNSKISVEFKNNILNVSFDDIKIMFVVNLYDKPKVSSNIQNPNSSVIIGKYSLIRKNSKIHYHNDDYIIGNKNNNSEILKLIIYGTNNQSERFYNTIWNNCRRELQLLKGRYNKKITGNPGCKS